MSANQNLQATCEHPYVEYRGGPFWSEIEYHRDGRPPTISKHQHCYCPRCGMLFDRYLERKRAEIP